MTLGDKQRLLGRLLPHLLIFILSEGFSYRIAFAKRCEDCKVKFKGHRQGSYYVVLKTCYVREGEKGVFTKIGFWCPSCHRFYDIDRKKPNVLYQEK